MKLSLVPIFFFSIVAGFAQNRIIIDADTANEVDDPYAIVRALIESSIEVVGLNSAQWQYSHWATRNTLEDSQRLNVMLLSFLKMSHIRHPRGAHFRLYDWGQDIAQHSAAAYHIIKEAHKTGEKEKLSILTLGASTNVASAILIDPSIVNKIRVYLLGTSYDFERKLWKKEDFNCLNDPHSISILLETPGLETHIMPINVCSAMKFNIDEVRKEFSGRNDLLDFLYRRWVNHYDGGRYSRVIWDLALVEAYLHPEWSEEIQVTGPRENGSRPVQVYSKIETDLMKRDFFKSIRSYFEK